ncbi:MAG: ATP synthase subunit I [Deltaproteobacteria bacterium]|nr:ATP synthase subunit I [Deltaproteobacteria bacterium]
MDWEKVYGDLRRLNWLILLTLGIISYFLMKHSFTTGIILGGLIIIANFHVFQHTFRSMLSPEGVMKTTLMSVIVKYYFRLLVLGIIIYILITRGGVDPVGLTIGLSTVVISIVSFGIKRAFKMYSREATE